KVWAIKLKEEQTQSICRLAIALTNTRAIPFLLKSLCIKYPTDTEELGAIKNILFSTINGDDDAISNEKSVLNMLLRVTEVMVSYKYITDGLVIRNLTRTGFQIRPQLLI